MIRNFFGFTLILSIVINTVGFTQELNLSKDGGISITDYRQEDGWTNTFNGLPLFSCVIDDKLFLSSNKNLRFDDTTQMWKLAERLRIGVLVDSGYQRATKLKVHIKNISPDTVIFENMVPFGALKDHVYITGKGPWSLARAFLFRPGKEPLGVILPDNTWEMGYGTVELDDGTTVCAIARRTNVDNAKKHRYKTYLFPGGTVDYDFYINEFEGEWQNGLKLMFQENWLYDLDTFNDSLYKRKDLAWIRNQYFMVLQTAWDHEFYDREKGGYQFKSYLDKCERLCGKLDVYGLWPTFPTLGLDQRNQWDLYEDLPGGLTQLREISKTAKDRGTAFFISYNPWDQSTRKENHYEGMARLIKAIDADGVVLDTRGKSSWALQHVADSVKPGVIMYSEGMAIPKDMPGIVAGRVHDAIFMPPPLNLNKLIRPDFAIFRVCQLSQGKIKREVNISLFNGYGVELNTFAPGRPDWIDEEMAYLGKAVMILRENTTAFNSFNWTPLIPTLEDNIWVNRFPSPGKTIYTIYSLKPEGFNGPLFLAPPKDDTHWVSMWNHEELKPQTVEGKQYLPVSTAAFDKSWLDTRQESSVDCIAALPELLDLSLNENMLDIKVKKGDEIRLWNGDPSYQNKFQSFEAKDQVIDIYKLFGVVENKLVVQLFGKDELMDEKIIRLQPGTPRLISKVEPTKTPKDIPADMVVIPAGEFKMGKLNGEDFIPYPKWDTTEIRQIHKFYMDKYPVTNNQYYDFIESTGYKPEDTVNYLKNWKDGKYPRGMKNYPVVYVSYDDAQAYAKWAGKRLPTELEWQYAAQGIDGRHYPWGNEMDSTKCNTGSGEMTPVNQYPGGSSPFGVMDLIGNVWQLTNDLYDNGAYYYIIIRGGSYYDPTSSWWYVKGGPQPLDRTQMLLRVAPGFERNATVGFRCVMDSE